MAGQDRIDSKGELLTTPISRVTSSTASYAIHRL